MENKKSYQELEAFINSLGDIRNVANNVDIIRAILTSNMDRHLICALIDKINAAVEAKQLSYDELPYFRSGQLADDIIKLRELIPIYGNVPSRGLFPSEILDKLNYMSIISDPQTLSANYTHPTIIGALAGKEMNPGHELTWWSTCGTFSTMDPKVQQRIILSVMQEGDFETAQKLCSEACFRMPVSQFKAATNEKTY